MFHLDLETLARIADGPADEAEAAHLEGCSECRADLVALREQTTALGALTPPPVPDTVWRRVERRLRSDSIPIAAPRRARIGPWLLRAAAALALFLAGAAAGASFDREPATVARGGDATMSKAVPVVSSDPARTLREAENLYAAALARYMAEGGGSQAELDPMRRLAALESIILTTRAALDESPEDAVIAGYHRTALVQREALLSQVQLADSEVWF
jgi:hypothetical protein